MLHELLDQFGTALDEMDKLLTRNRIFVDRTKDIGVISKERAVAYALSGPILRGSGVEHDLRRKHPYLDYEQYDFEVVIGSAGDCYDRYLVRIEEMRQSATILRRVIDRLPSGPINVADWKNMTPPKSHVMTKMEELIHHFIVVTEGLDAPPGEIYFAAENPKGELGFYINSKGGGVPHRLKIRAPSFVNLSILPELLPGHMVSDVPAELERKIDEAIGHYPPDQKRSAALPLLHLWQEHFGLINDDAVTWIAAKLGLQPINIFELVTFYPMLREKRAGKTHIRVCRTLSCAMAGSYQVMENLCAATGIQRRTGGEGMHTPVSVSADGNYSIEFVECLASCGTAPVCMVNDSLHESINP